jgi:hypothetical protein
MFDATSGSIYTHVSSSHLSSQDVTGSSFINQMIYDGLLSRNRFRGRMGGQSHDIPSHVQCFACLQICIVLNESSRVYIFLEEWDRRTHLKKVVLFL